MKQTLLVELAPTPEQHMAIQPIAKVAEVYRQDKTKKIIVSADQKHAHINQVRVRYSCCRCKLLTLAVGS